MTERNVNKDGAEKCLYIGMIQRNVCTDDTHHTEKWRCLAQSQTEIRVNTDDTEKCLYILMIHRNVCTGDTEK